MVLFAAVADAAQIRELYLVAALQEYTDTSSTGPWGEKRLPYYFSQQLQTLQGPVAVDYDVCKDLGAVETFGHRRNGTVICIYIHIYICRYICRFM